MFLVSIVVKETNYSFLKKEKKKLNILSLILKKKKKKKKKTKYEVEYHTPNNIFL